MARNPTAQQVAASQRARKKVKKNVSDGIAHVHASFNNTIITITDRQGNTLSWATSGGVFLRHCVLGTVPLSGIYDKPERLHLVRSPEAGPAFLIALNDLQGFTCCCHHLDFSGSHLVLCAVVTFGADAPMFRPGIDVHAVCMGETCDGQDRTEGETWDESADTRKKHVISS